MTTHPEALAPAADRTASATDRSRSTLAAGALALAAASVAGVLVVRPWPVRNAFEYDQISPNRDAIWAGVLVDGLAFAVVGVALSLVVCGLVRSRGAVWATVGAVVTSLGGIAFAMGAFAFAALAWYSTDTTVLSEEQGARLLDHMVDNPQHAMVLQMAGFATYTLGSLLLTVALFRSRAVPRWVPGLVVALTLAQFSGLPDRPLDLVQIALMAVLVVLAWMAVRVRADAS